MVLVVAAVHMVLVVLVVLQGIVLLVALMVVLVFMIQAIYNSVGYIVLKVLMALANNYRYL